MANIKKEKTYAEESLSFERAEKKRAFHKQKYQEYEMICEQKANRLKTKVSEEKLLIEELNKSKTGIIDVTKKLNENGIYRNPRTVRRILADIKAINKNYYNYTRKGPTGTIILMDLAAEKSAPKIIRYLVESKGDIDVEKIKYVMINFTDLTRAEKDVLVTDYCRCVEPERIIEDRRRFAGAYIKRKK